MNRYQRALLFASYLWAFGEGLLGPLYAVFTQQIGGDIMELTGAYAFYLIIMGSLSLFFGKISDKGKSKNIKKYFLIAGFGLNAIATFGYLLVDNPLKLFVLQGVLGLASALATPAWLSFYSVHGNKNNLGAAWGFDDGGTKVIMGIAVLSGGILLTHFGFTFLFILMGSIQLLANIVLLRMFFRRAMNGSYPNKQSGK